MASTTTDVIRRALRFLGVLSAGKVPTGSMLKDGLESLQSLVLALPGLLHNGVWREVAVTGAYTAREGDRCTVSGSGAVTLPTTVDTCIIDDCTPAGGSVATRPPMDLAKAQISGSVGNAGIWLYSASKAKWLQADALTAASEVPFGEEDVQGLAAQLAVNMMDEYGDQQAMSDRTTTLAGNSAKSMRARMKKAEPEDWNRPTSPYSHRQRDYW
jgi:hypothetical protein